MKYINMSNIVRNSLLFSLAIFLLLPLANAQCVIPYEDMVVNATTSLCMGTYYLNDTNANGAIIINGSNLIFDCNSSSLVGNVSADSKGIFIEEGNSNVTVVGCDLRGYYTGIYGYGNQTDLNLSSNTIDSYQNGIRFDGGTNVNDVLLENNTIYVNNRTVDISSLSGIDLRDATYNGVRVVGNDINVSSSGSYVYSLVFSISGEFYNVEVINNTIRGYGAWVQTLFQPADVQDCYFYGNQIYGDGGGVWLLGMDIPITNCTVENTIISVSGNGLSYYNVRNIIIDGAKVVSRHCGFCDWYSYFSPAFSYNVTLTNSNLTVTSYATDYDWNVYAVYLPYVDNFSLSSSVIDANYSGIYLKGNNSEFKNNRITNHGRKAGIYLFGFIDNVTIDSNTFENTAENYFIGHYLDWLGANITITNNTGNGKPIYYYSHSSGLDVSGLDGYLVLYDVNSSTFRNINAPVMGNILVGNKFYDVTINNGIGFLSYYGDLNEVHNLYCDRCDSVYQHYYGTLTVYDSVISNSEMEGVYSYAGGNITLINTTFDKYTFYDTVSHIFRKWYLDLSLNVPADVEIYDSFNNLVYQNTTSSDRIILLEYDKWCYNFTGTCIEERNLTFTPHNISASAVGYLPNSTLVSMNTNRNVFLYLEQIVVSLLLSFNNILFGSLSVNTANNPALSQDLGIYNVTLYSNVPFNLTVTGYDFVGPSAWSISNLKIALNDTLLGATLSTAKSLVDSSPIELLSLSSIDATYYFKFFLSVPDILAGDYSTSLLFLIEQL